MIRVSEINSKNIVNAADGRILGHICDLEIDPDDGKIRSILLPGAIKQSFFRKKELITIPWREIKKIGFDVILVDSTGHNIPDFLIENY